jgi:hypothetical protein
MRGRSRLESLLALRGRRVTQAMQYVEACNRVAREKEFERDVARRRWTEADGTWRQQQREYADEVSSNLHHDVSSNGLAFLASQCDWWRARVDECFGTLQVAQAVLNSAETAASRARQDYMRARARHDALLTLMTDQRKAERRVYERLDQLSE